MKTILPTILTLFLAGSAIAEPVEFDSIAAEVNGKPILWSEVRGAVATQVRLLHEERAKLTPLDYANRLNELLEKGRQALIDRELMLGHFADSGFEMRDLFVDNQVDERIQKQFDGDQVRFTEFLGSIGMTLNDYRGFVRDEMVLGAMRRKFAPEPLFLTPKEVEETYLANADLFTIEGQVALRTVTLPKDSPDATEAEQRAKIGEIRQQLLDGGDFESFAKLYSTDSFGQDGGLRTGAKRVDLVEEFRDPAFSLRPGEVSEIVEGPGFFAILRVEERVEDQLLDLMEVREKVEMLAMQRKRSQALDRWLQQLRHDASIRLKS